jgi:hypothetical protein
MEEMERRIAEEAGKRYPDYNMLLKKLGISDSMAGREVLAELLTYIDFVNSSLRGLKRLMGLYRPVRSRRKRRQKIYDGKLHQAIVRLSMAYYKNRPSGR